MINKQEEFYNQIRLETEVKIKTYKEFQEQISRLKALTEDSISKLKTDMKFIVKQIESNNQMLSIQGFDPVEFDK